MLGKGVNEMKSQTREFLRRFCAVTLVVLMVISVMPVNAMIARATDDPVDGGAENNQEIQTESTEPEKSDSEGTEN